ncbi:uncharacterized protein M6B38_152230 [Iris pallida]|uniref:Protein Lines C-terminal domain-containing protein n=1 Tax=Iris pallida TaxID=29817 RepID=A0AAX6F7X8_IRIPA|nr:uncharacterized protein M6B38_152230 [Iris pallida]
MAVSVPKAPALAIAGICDMITASLLPIIEPNPSLVTEEIEKNMLLSLSLVHRKIKQLELEEETLSQSEKVFVLNSNHGRYCCQHQDQASICLQNIVINMVSFLSIDNRFVQHVSGNIFVSISIFLTKHGSRWVEFILLLWISLEAAISSTNSSTLLCSAVEPIVRLDENLFQLYPPSVVELFGKEDKGSDFTRFIEVLQSRLANTNWHMVTAIFRILRNILKSLKRENDDLEEAFVNLAVPFLTKMPWDLFAKINVSQSHRNPKKSDNDDLPDKKNWSNGTKGVLLGSVLQLFCSLVERNDAEDSEDGPLGDCAVYSKFAHVLPKLLHCCFSEHLRHKDKCISQYLLHKLLISMNRLSCYNEWRSSHPALWLKLLRRYFGDLLSKSISDYDANSQNCLEGSPFLASIDDAYTCPGHLQRQLIFLLLKCCITLSHTKEIGKGCACSAETPYFSTGLQLCSENCCLIGLLELSEWLQRFGFLQMLKDGEDYLKACSTFALSFLQLYMEEDDMLFAMLLLLLDVPFTSWQIKRSANDESHDKVERDVPFHIANIFNPIHLFHLFLLLLHYDHLVLVDYLISKDTGVHCVQYLLRLLRLICQSWSIFAELSPRGSGTDRNCQKRRKISVDKNCNEILGSFSSSSSVITRQFMPRQKSHCSHKNISLHSFEKAKECLVSLKRSVADMHQKSLFPYNPRALLKSLARFEDLCLQ